MCLQVSVAIGCATRDRTVAFASTFAAFFSRAYDQIRMGAISQSNVNLVGSHCGVSIGKPVLPEWTISYYCCCYYKRWDEAVYFVELNMSIMEGLVTVNKDPFDRASGESPLSTNHGRACPPGEDGPSQMALEDLAMFRAIPTCTVFYPSDAVSAERAVELAANTKVGVPPGSRPISLDGCGRVAAPFLMLRASLSCRESVSFAPADQNQRSSTPQRRSLKWAWLR